MLPREAVTFCMPEPTNRILLVPDGASFYSHDCDYRWPTLLRLPPKATQEISGFSFSYRQLIFPLWSASFYSQVPLPRSPRNPTRFESLRAIPYISPDVNTCTCTGGSLPRKRRSPKSLMRCLHTFPHPHVRHISSSSSTLPNRSPFSSRPVPLP